jgi:hypothetical protein
MSEWINSESFFRTWRNSLIAAGVVSTLAMGGAVYKVYDDGQNRRKLLEPHLAPEDSVHVKSGTFVYKGQKESRCIGDIEKTVPLIDKGEVKGMIVYCKPDKPVK